MLLEPPMLAEHVTIVADIDHEGILRESYRVEPLDQPADLRIDE